MAELLSAQKAKTSSVPVNNFHMDWCAFLKPLNSWSCIEVG
jgi:hypothetical protein